MSQPNIEQDPIICKIADYVHNYEVKDYSIARLCLFDSFACAMMALQDKKCTKLLGPYFKNCEVENAVPIPGTGYILDPIKATFDISTMIRWLDFNDTWLAKEWGHPSDNIGGILAITDLLSRQYSNFKFNMSRVLQAIVKAYEIQGCLAIENCFNAIGIDHVILVKIATAAVCSWLAGGSISQTISAIAHAFQDGHSLRCYRHGSNTSARKSWAAGDAAAKGVWLAWVTIFAGDTAGSQPITAKTWGFNDVYFKDQQLQLSRELNEYVIENILFKVKFPAEFHGQTAVECAIELNKLLDSLDSISKIEITTQKPAITIIDKKGKLNNYADRDHCIQYMVAVALLEGSLEPRHYSDSYANKNKLIDKLRGMMIVKEDPGYTSEYYNLDKRAIPNSIQIFYQDGTKTDKLEVKYPLGHKQRREESMIHLRDKYNLAIKTHFSANQQQDLLHLWEIDDAKLHSMQVNDFMQLWHLKI